jgi:hypothetical protein
VIIVVAQSLRVAIAGWILTVFWLAVIELLWRYKQSAVGTADAFGGVESGLSWLTLSDIGG